MSHKKSKKRPVNATRASVEKEMAKPREARSARIGERNLDSARIPEQPSTTMRGIVKRIIPSPRPGQPEMAQVAFEGADGLHRDFRFENTLTDENGDDARLQKGSRVEVTITDESKPATQ
jgi:hypothetical protein